jgi:hypothetical protein
MKILKTISEKLKKKLINTLQTALAIHVNCQKEVRIYINIFYCVYNAAGL